MFRVHQLTYIPSDKGSFRLEIPEFTWDGRGVLALVGSNGSGKSTLMSLIAGLKKPTTGTCTFAGYNTFFSYDKVKFNLPLISWDIPLSPQLKPKSYLKLVRDLASKWNHELENRLLDEFSIPTDQNIGSLSRGEQAKVKILLASCSSPEILLIDELTSDLDTDSRKKIFNFLDEQVFSETFGIIWASNVMTDVEKYATHIAVLNKGKLVASETLDDFKVRHQKIALHSISPERKIDLSFLRGEKLSWDGQNGLLSTKEFSKDLEKKLLAEGVTLSLLPYSLAEIINEYGV